MKRRWMLFFLKDERNVNTSFREGDGILLSGMELLVLTEFMFENIIAIILIRPRQISFVHVNGFRMTTSEPQYLLRSHSNVSI